MGLATLYYTLRKCSTPKMARDSLFTAAIFGSLCWLAGLSAILYPGSKAIDPEFGEGFPQFGLFLGLGAGSWIAWWLETSRDKV